MTEYEVFGLLLIVMGLSFVNWRLGVLICLYVGFIQDPLRKLLPGEPVYMTVMVGAPLLMTMLGAHLRRVSLTFRPLHAWKDVLRTPLNFFVLLVLLQSAAAFFRTGNPIIGAIGALSYLAPFPAILLGYQFSRNKRDISRVIKVYMAVSILMVPGVYLAYAGYDWPVLKQVGEGLFIYSLQKGRLDLFAGFLRSPEIAAWHAATAACLLFLVALAVRGKTYLKWGAGFLVPALLGAILLTGRRKFLVEVLLFMSLYALFLILFARTSIKSAALARSALLLTAGLGVASVVFMFIVTDNVADEMTPYYERGVSVRNDITDRVSGMTVGSFELVIAENGFLGSGAGTGSQGVQHFGKQTTGVNAEGGLSKVLAELGVPGLLLLLWLGIGFVRYLWSIASFVTSDREVDPALSRLVFGLVALLISNGFLYIVAHQIFGDPFVLIVLGFFLGFVMATPKMVTRANVARRLIDDRRLVDRAQTDCRSEVGRWQTALPVRNNPSPAIVHTSSAVNK